jgi:outer membrane protein assembly factor BamB
MPLTRRHWIQGLLAQTIARAAHAQTRVHAAPKPLAKDAVTHEWRSFLGPTRNAVSTETRLNRTLPPRLLWEFTKGTGYASPAVAGDRVLFIHRAGNEEVVVCLGAETGARQWEFRYPTDFEDRYGYNNGPRSSPIVEGDRVYSVGAQGQLHCLELSTGKLHWRRNIATEYKVPQDFFGTASTPLLEDGRLIVNVGAPGGPCVAALDPTTGRELWRAGKDWGPSYASPIPATVHNRRRVFVFAGGESTPPSGGLLCIDPANGRVDFTFPWRSRSYESVNASCPVIFDNKVFISASYRTGGALVEIRPDFTHRVVWTTQEFGLHWNTPIHRDGYLYGFDGRNEPDASLACVDAATGRIVWRATPEWNELIGSGTQRRPQLMSTYRGSLLAVDGQFLCLGEVGHLLWMDLSPKGHKELSRAWLFAARESWALPVLSRGLLYVVQNTRDILDGSPPRLLCYDLRQ